MVATNAHRLWVVQPDVPSPQPSTPSGQPASKTHGPSHHAAHNGKLIGVVSLTDILNIANSSVEMIHPLNTVEQTILTLLRYS
ncbi:Protein SDS23 [Yarrowia lipolytica]|nr:Protein SDS23 [Yarrowia lipolytica]